MFSFISLAFNLYYAYSLFRAILPHYVTRNCIFLVLNISVVLVSTFFETSSLDTYSVHNIPSIHLSKHIDIAVTLFLVSKEIVQYSLPHRMTDITKHFLMTFFCYLIRYLSFGKHISLSQGTFRFKWCTYYPL